MTAGAQRDGRGHRAASGGPEGASAVVVGGGLAGTTAALALADAGLRVTLVEGRPRLGGLVFSFRRGFGSGDLSVDNGQHVFLRCCTAYSGFLDRLGAAHLVPLQDRMDVPVLDADRMRLGRLRRTALPVPLHLARSLALYPHLSPAERAGVVRATLALKGLDLDDPALDAVDFGSWLRRYGQSARAVEALWDLVGVATLNATAGHASLGLAAKVFKTGLLSDPGAADIGWSRVPLGEVHDTLARAALEKAGVRVALRTRAGRVARTDDGWQVSVGSGPHDREQLTADTVVLALPQRETHALLPDGALDDKDRLLGIGTAPILNVHVVYDRKVLRRPFFAAVGSPVQWVFDRTDASGIAQLPEGAGCQYLALSQSAAQEEIEEPVAKLRARYLPELERLLPAARGARIRDFFVTRERTATFAPEPGVGRLRPAARTRTAGLYLAGAWTATGWPATMEGAVRSGTVAAREALTELGFPQGQLPQEAA
ncbi:hydroxysqualene dehydroxylase HpnE [Streptomyces pinistramenti]|uniref:hydroxysqualene dehydroxylase HpnE n=1 Tax=Streptomyces pinistramenti TaxID=2884812 RepID=UPI001D083854|nr:hydroxysqualene dehydroxylase HpnE [Streptomyces pinistramenti]MCB5906062.1 hydroxysqualene dehydroxylase HpnE [Streptomyces pinistramenti]